LITSFLKNYLADDLVYFSLFGRKSHVAVGDKTATAEIEFCAFLP